MIKKPQIQEFNPVIYPFKLWVGITDDFNNISDNFRYYPSFDEIERFSEGKYVAFTHLVENKENKYLGVLITFHSISWCTNDYIAHEATHAARFIWDHLNEHQTGIEADAYLVQWIVKCIEKVKRGEI